jgi:DNA-binding response OmpR family regulator
MMRILLAEDEQTIATNIMAAFERAGYTTEIARDGETAWFRGETEEFDLIVLDLGLPKIDGLTVLKNWRAAGRQTPVLILTARGAWPERVEGIDAGADDYLPKPFQLEELVARVRALIRRAAGHGSPVLEVGAISVDTRQLRVALNGEEVQVSPLEYRLITYLLHHKRRVIPATELIDHLYGNDDVRDVNALEALLTRLRRKLGSDVIRTRRGFGYFVDG